MQDYPTGRALFDAAVQAAPERDFIRYFDRTLTYRAFAADCDALAAALAADSPVKGDRVALFVQNVPEFLIALVACWRLGLVAVPINPMNRVRELTAILGDCTPSVLIVEEALYDEVYRRLPPEAWRPARVILTSPTSGLAQVDPRAFSPATPISADGAEHLEDVFVRYRGETAADAPLDEGDVALLVYTSGTTGKPKGTIITQAAVALGAQLSRDTQGLPEHATAMVVAPLFHIAGIVMAVGSAVHARGTLILSYRVNLALVLDLIEAHRPVTISASITAYIALMTAAADRPEVLSCVRIPLSGGAPVPPRIVDEYMAMTGCRIRTGYGLTETSGGAFMEPADEPRRVDPVTGALSVGKAARTFTVRIVGEDGSDLPTGEAGEVVLSGPAVSPGYWQNPGESAESMRADGFRTGDIGFLDDDGWLYLVDRKKDMIVAAGYKVWPREVEDVIYTHPAVHEVAVVPSQDPYRGETVKAVVTLRPGARLDAAELIEFCKQRLAAYKYPRLVEFRDELPKSPAGKILKRELYDVV